jgi:hypothetical protein
MRKAAIPLLIVMLAGALFLAACSDITGQATYSAVKAVCGNNKMEPGEDCDISDLGGITCQDLGYMGGPLRCYSDCTRDTSQCIRTCRDTSCSACFRGKCDEKCDTRFEGLDCNDCNDRLPCCGDYNCNPGETPQNCPVDCSS